MGQIPASTIGTATTLPVSGISWGQSPFAVQPFGIQSFPQQYYGQPSASQFGYGLGAAQPLQQILQFLQAVPQQLQQLQILQQQQLAQVQQLLQLVPAQLQQLQQLIQFVPQQVQYLQQQQPYGSAISGPVGFGLAAQTFAGQGANYVM